MNKPVSLFRKKELYLGMVRYSLAIVMMSYGLFKIQGAQGNIIYPFSAWQHPLEQISGKQLTWAFLGYARWFSILMGLFEFIPACLLLFRRTYLLGALLLFPMTLSVFLINQAMDLWYYTKVLSVCLVALNISIFLFERKTIWSLFEILFDKTRRLHKWLPEIIINIILIIALIFLQLAHPSYDSNEKNVLTGDWWNRHQNEFTLISESIGDSSLPHHTVKAYFGPNGDYSEINDSIDNGNGCIHYTIDEQKQLLGFSFRRTEDNNGNHYNLSGNFKYELTGDTLLKLVKDGEQPENQPHIWLFKKRAMNIKR